MNVCNRTQMDTIAVLPCLGGEIIEMLMYSLRGTRRGSWTVASVMSTCARLPGADTLWTVDDFMRSVQVLAMGLGCTICVCDMSHVCRIYVNRGRPETGYIYYARETRGTAGCRLETSRFLTMPRRRPTCVGICESRVA